MPPLVFGAEFHHLDVRYDHALSKAASCTWRSACELGGCLPGTFPSDTWAGDRGADPSSGCSGACGSPRFPVGTVGPDRSGGSGQGAESSGTTTAANALSARTNGEAYGLELFLKRRLTSRVGGFLSYTLSRSVRTFEDRKFVASFDRTHEVNAALAYNLGRNWRAGTRITFYTGLPKAPDPTDPGSTRLPPFFGSICGSRSAGS